MKVLPLQQFGTNLTGTCEEKWADFDLNCTTMAGIWKISGHFLPKKIFLPKSFDFPNELVRILDGNFLSKFPTISFKKSKDFGRKIFSGRKWPEIFQIPAIVVQLRSKSANFSSQVPARFVPNCCKGYWYDVQM